MYSLWGHACLLADQVRTAAYARALAQVLRPGDICLDLGTGTGFFALLACRLAAGKVIAVEPNAAIGVARELAAANGCAEQITFVQELSTQVQLAERAQVILADLRGVLPLYGRHLPDLRDARCRLLASEGTLIPHRDEIWAALAEAPGEYARAVPLGHEPAQGLDLTALHGRLVNCWHKVQLQPSHLLAAPQRWVGLDYTRCEEDNFQATLTWTIERPGTGHGVLLWFDAELVPGIGFSCAPGQPETSYGQGFFPWQRPVVLAAGDTVEVALRADLVGADYVWGWDSRVRAGEAEGPLRAAFHQSTFWGSALALAPLHRRAAEHRPRWNEEGAIDHLILTLLNAAPSLGAVAREVAAQFPHRFPSWHDALPRVGDLAEKYSR